MTVLLEWAVPGAAALLVAVATVVWYFNVAQLRGLNLSSLGLLYAGWICGAGVPYLFFAAFFLSKEPTFPGPADVVLMLTGLVIGLTSLFLLPWLTLVALVWFFLSVREHRLRKSAVFVRTAGLAVVLTGLAVVLRYVRLGPVSLAGLLGWVGVGAFLVPVVTGVVILVVAVWAIVAPTENLPQREAPPSSSRGQRSGSARR